ncbi:MAG: hypothetical protein ACD_4C00288G0003, partial [uncultured bacterium (gcode 4)]
TYLTTYISKKNLIYKSAVLLVSLYAFWITISNSGRGTLICIFIFFAIYTIFVSKKIIVNIIGVATSLFMTISIMNIREVLVLAHNFFTNFNITISAVEKSIWLLEHESLMHGRSELYYSIFKNANEWELVFGRGIGGFENSSGTYAHNMFLSLYTEFGMISIFIILFFIFSLVMIFKKSKVENKKFLTILIANSISKLMISSIHWRSSELWLLVGLILKKQEKVDLINTEIRKMVEE